MAESPVEVSLRSISKQERVEKQLTSNDASFPRAQEEQQQQYVDRKIALTACSSRQIEAAATTAGSRRHCASRQQAAVATAGSSGERRQQTTVCKRTILTPDIDLLNVKALHLRHERRQGALIPAIVEAAACWVGNVGTLRPATCTQKENDTLISSAFSN